MSDSAPFRVLVTGAKYTTARDNVYIRRVLTKVCAEALRAGRRVVVVDGGWPTDGVDRAASRWAAGKPGVESETHPPHGFMGRQASNLVNRRMVAEGADVCVAFPNASSTRTWNCLQQAAKAGIVGLVYPIVGVRKEQDDVAEDEVELSAPASGVDGRR